MATKKAAPETPYVDPWQAKDDARTLGEAAAIHNDPKRHTAAKAHVDTLHSAVYGGAVKALKKATPQYKKPAVKKAPLMVTKKKGK